MRSVRLFVGLVLAGLLVPSFSSASVIRVAPGAVSGSANGCSLIDAINAANQSVIQNLNVTVGRCAPVGAVNQGSGGYSSDGTVLLLGAGTYTLTSIDNDWYGPNGLPPIATSITLVGSPQGSTITRSSANGTPPFRFFYVGGGQSLTAWSPPTGLSSLPGRGTLTLMNFALSNGLVHGGNSSGGGGGMGAGGAIYNQGVLNLIGMTLTGNRAIGGGANFASSGAGGGIAGNADLSGAGGGFQYPGGPWPAGNTALGTFGNGGVNGIGNRTGGVGGGGGAGAPGLNGARGGYGGGGGAGTGASSNGGDGGFGGGGGMSPFGTGGGSFAFGGSGSSTSGGGGAGLGGAIFNEGGALGLQNSTLTSNAAIGGVDGNGFPTGAGAGRGVGGGIFNLAGPLIVIASTLAGNQADIGGAIASISGPPHYFGSPTADLGNPVSEFVNSSILSGSKNAQGASVPDCDGFNPLSNDSLNFRYDAIQLESGGAGGCPFDSTDQYPAAPTLGALAANGGPTQTMVLSGTPGTGQGDPNNSPLLDQRGYVRNPTAPSIGAYEPGALPSVVGVGGLVDISVALGANLPNQPFTLSDNGDGILGVSVQSSNTTLLPLADIQVSNGCGNTPGQYDCALALTPVPGQVGTTTVTVTAADGYGNLGSQSFTLTVTAQGITRDLGVVVDDHRGFIDGGSLDDYTILVQNLGTQAVNGASVTDTLPANFTGASWTCQPLGGAACRLSGSGSIADTVDLPVGGALIYTLSGTVTAIPETALMNTATVAMPTGIIDQNPANNSATDTDTVGIFRSGFETLPPGVLATAVVTLTSSSVANANSWSLSLPTGQAALGVSPTLWLRVQDPNGMTTALVHLRRIEGTLQARSSVRGADGVWRIGVWQTLDPDRAVRVRVPTATAAPGLRQ